MSRKSLPLLCIALLFGCQSNSPPPSSQAMESRPALAVTQPIPTENWLGTDAEKKNRAGRKQWIEDMHWTSPDIDWREVEAGNGRELMARRRAMLQSRGPRLLNWTEKGSRNLAGRMHAVGLGLDGTSLYAGSSRGGVWRGTLEGESWTPLADNLWGGAHHVAIGDGGGTEVIVTMTDGGGIHMSIDEGMSWTVPAGIRGGRDQGRRLWVDPLDRSRVYALIRHSGAGTSVYRSDDGGQNFAELRANSSRHGDLWMHRLDGTPLFLLDGHQVYRSDDFGDSWQHQGDAPDAQIRGAVLAGSEAGGPTLYVALRNQARNPWDLYRSTDGGVNWDPRGTITDFWQSMAASIYDEDLIATGGVEVYRSTNGGNQFAKVNAWGEYYGDPLNKLHADVPGLEVLPDAGAEIWFVATDGGLYRSDDGLQTVRNLSMEGLGVSQYYSTHTSVNDPDLILAGAQDQGYQRTSDASAPYQAFDQLISGDYGHMTSWDGSHDRVISVYPGFILVQDGEMNPRLSQVNFPDGSSQNWLPMVLADPTDRDAFFFCADYLYRYQKNGTGDWEYIRAWPNPFTADGANYLTAMAISSVDTDRRYLSNNRGVVWWTANGGGDWNQSIDFGPDPHYFYGNALTTSGNDPLLAYLGGSGYNGPAVYRTTDGGQSWTAVADGLPSTLVYDLVFQSPESNVLFAATEAGPYRLDPLTDTWEYIGDTVAPLTTYWSVEAVPAGGVVRFGTYGRGIWDFHITGPNIPEDCFDGIDNDEDEMTDCDDTDCQQLDGDGDTYFDCTDDCAPADPLTWAAPDPISSLSVEKFPALGADVGVLKWITSGAGSSQTTYDVISGDLFALHASGWPSAAECLAEDEIRASVADFGSSSSRWYLVRSVNSCGRTTYGVGSLGERSPSGTACND